MLPRKVSAAVLALMAASAAAAVASAELLRGSMDENSANALKDAFADAQNKVKATLAEPSPFLGFTKPSTKSEERKLQFDTVPQDPEFVAAFTSLGLPCDYMITELGPNPNEEYNPILKALINKLWYANANVYANGALAGVAQEIVRAAEKHPSFGMTTQNEAAFSKLSDTAEIFAVVVLLEALALGQTSTTYGTMSQPYTQAIEQLNQGSAEDKNLAAFMTFVATGLGEYFTPMLGAYTAKQDWQLSETNMLNMLAAVLQEANQLTGGIVTPTKSPTNAATKAPTRHPTTHAPTPDPTTRAERGKTGSPTPTSRSPTTKPKHG